MKVHRFKLAQSRAAQLSRYLNPKNVKKKLSPFSYFKISSFQVYRIGITADITYTSAVALNYDNPQRCNFIQ